jgi:cold shock CspA family protein
LDLYVASVIRTGTALGTSLLAENTNIPPLAIPQQAPLASRFLVEVSFEASGVKAKRWWLISQPVQPVATRPAVKGPVPMHRGRIISVDQQLRFVFIETADGACRVFGHSSELRGVSMRLGQQVSFKIGTGAKGPVALEVRAA